MRDILKITSCCALKKTDGTTVFSKPPAKFDLADLQIDPGFMSLSAQRRARLEAHYKSINPRLMIDLLDASNGSQKIGVYSFRDSPDYIFAALVENLYSLRCILFHGEIVPTTDINAVYESAYHILKRFLRSIV